MAIAQIFTPASAYKRQARVVAILWTILILVGCFTPAKELPKVDVPLIDKWVHILFFSGFAFLWLCGYPPKNMGGFLKIWGIAILFGIFIEIMQGILTFLGRSMEFMDAVADTIGALIGIIVFYLIAQLVNRVKG